MKKIVCKIKIKKDVELDKLGDDFYWKIYDTDRGIYWTNNIITIFSNTREIYYDKLTQEVFDCILKLCMEGKTEWIKK